MTSILKKSMICSNYDWFKDEIDDDFEIPDDRKSKIIFGFNGIGKTTLYRCIKEANSGKIDFVEYGEIKNIYKDDKILKISPNINEVNSLLEESKVISDNINNMIKSNMKNLNLTTKEKAKIFGEKAENMRKTNSKFLGFNEKETDIKEIRKLIDENIKLSTFTDLYSDLKQLSNAESEIENYKKQMLEEALSIITNIIDEKDGKCPVCGSNVENVKKIVEDKKRKLEGIKSEVIKKINDRNHINITRKIVDDLIEACRILEENESLKSEFVMCEGDTEKFKLISKNYEEFQEKQKSLNFLHERQKEFFENIKNVRNGLERDLKKYFNVTGDKITYDDKNFLVMIDFGRKLETYSTGEFNLICFLFKIYSFIGSNKEIILLDDPVSSLDMINQYKIAFEIVKQSNKKELIVLTHSIRLLNIIYSQNANNFDYYYLDKINGVIKINKIEVKNQKNNLISLANLEDRAETTGLIQAIKEKDSENSEEAQKVFHYDTEEHFYKDNKDNISNIKLVNSIENFNGFKSDDFYTNAYLKILYMCALRIWIEKSLYNIIPSENDKCIFLSRKTITEKINYLLPKNGQNKIETITENLKEILMSKKVMLNQCVHYYGQVVPLEYALNLSCDDIKSEIEELKEIFKNEKNNFEYNMQNQISLKI